MATLLPRPATPSHSPILVTSAHKGLGHHVQLRVYFTDEETESPSRKEGQGDSQASFIQHIYRAHLLSARSGRMLWAHQVRGNPQGLQR